MEKQSSLIKKALPVIIVFAGIMMFILLTALRKEPEKIEIENTGALVSVVEVKKSDRNISIMGTGNVLPRDEVTVLPQITGKIDWASPNFEKGGSFRKGETFIRIEQSDYILGVRRAKAALAQAEYGLQVAGANADIAKKEWDIVTSKHQILIDSGDKKLSEPDSLVLQIPQLLQAEANLESAKASLELTELNLERTEVKAPFNCRIRQHLASEGQLVSPASPIAKIYGTDIVEIEVGLHIADLAWIKVPGAEAIVKLNTGEKDYSWEGRVDRNTGTVDEIGRLAMVIVQVKNPFKRNSEYAPELSIGSFVSVEILGRTIENIFPVPRYAVRANSTVWVAADDNTLQIKKVNVEKMNSTEALISEGLSENDKVVLTNLTGVAPGLKIRPVLEVVVQ